MAIIKIKKLKDNAIIPTTAHEGDAGFDLYACLDNPLEIPAHTTVKIPTGISVELPKETFAGIFARSGLATKNGLRPANCVGVCDEPYRGEYIVALHNDSNETQIITPNERIAQMIIIPYVKPIIECVDNLSETERGNGGFGSSGK